MEMVLGNDLFEQVSMDEILSIDGGRSVAGDLVIGCCTVIGAIGGGIGGGLAGAAAGSAVPGIGTAFGGTVGAIGGVAAGGLAGAGVGVALADYCGL